MGVFARQRLLAGALVELAPVVVIETMEAPSYISSSGEMCHYFSDYTFASHLKGDGLECLPLGCGALYNHSAEPNVKQCWACAEPEEASITNDVTSGGTVP